MIWKLIQLGIYIVGIGPLIIMWILLIYSKFRTKNIYKDLRNIKYKGLQKNFKALEILRDHGIHCIPIKMHTLMFSIPHFIPFKLCFVSKIVGSLYNKTQEFLVYHELFHFKPQLFGFSRLHRYNELLASLVAKEEFLKFYSKKDLEKVMIDLNKVSSISGAITINDLCAFDFDLDSLRKN